ncbi:MAG: TetR/AcrR family transcriptional regulator [Myxococcota bacterium]
MPRPRFENLDPQRRDVILSNASESFLQGGLHGASLNDILARTGISKGVFYYYFDDKADLYATVVSRAVQHFEAEFKSHRPPEKLPASEFWQQLKVSYKALYRFSIDHAQVVGLVKTLAELSPEEIARLGVDARCVSWLERYFERGQRLGVVRKDLPMKVLMQIAASVDTSMGLWLFENPVEGNEMLDEGVDKVVEMHRRILETHVQFSQ